MILLLYYLREIIISHYYYIKIIKQDRNALKEIQTKKIKFQKETINID